MLTASNENAGFAGFMSSPYAETEVPAVDGAPAVESGREGFYDCGLSMDFDEIMGLLDEDQGSDQAELQNVPEEMQHSSPEELSIRGATEVGCPPHADVDKNSNFNNDLIETGGTPLLRTDVDATSSEVGRPGHWINSVGNNDAVFKPAGLDLSSQVTYQVEASASFKEWDPLGSGSDYCCTERPAHHPEFNIQGCSAVSGLTNEYAHQVIDCKDKLDTAWRNYVDEVHGDVMNNDTDPKCASQCPIMVHPDVGFGNYVGFVRNCSGASEVLENNSFNSVDSSFLDANTFSQNATSTESACQSSDGVSDCYYTNMAGQCSDNSLDFNPSWDQSHLSTSYKTLQSGEGMIVNMNGVGDFQNESGSCSSRISSNAGEERAEKSFSEQLMRDGSNSKGHRLIYNSGHYTDDAVTRGSLTCDWPYIQSRAQAASVKDEVQDSVLTSINTMHHSAHTTETAMSNRSAYGVDECSFFDRGSEQFSAITQKFGTPSIDVNESVICAGKRNWHSSVPPRLLAYPKREIGGVIPAWKRARNSYELVGGSTRLSIDSGNMDMKASDQYLPRQPQSVLSMPELGISKEESQNQLNQPDIFDELIVSPETFYGDTSGCNVQVEDDSDVCIIGEVKRPVRPAQSISLGTSLVSSRHGTLFNSHVASQHLAISRAVGYSGVGGSRLRANDERSVFRVALQDLSQPKSEATPPDGLLAVPLLRHQRIALSWMIQKETTSLHCSGGILADDQGLGKTVSSIALILKERPSSSRVCEEDIQQGMLEAVNLDEDDDNFFGKEKLETTNNFMQLKGRPAAGTLVVCPTSVLRQWAEELQNKVTSKANISVLVYHGGNRTKDPSELAKYDVVLTTYSIVSMEVPKQPFGDKDNQEKKVRDCLAETYIGASSSKSTDSCGRKKKSSKNTVESESTLLETLAHPLAKVGWFRVILDEAQSIKNHKTQVARACWGLRAKRRWCLSGTPIQNTVDDLYSYFRFLRYDPYSSYKLFCHAIKFPISKNPTKGYKKLQAVLKTIMLRRTKGTLIDGKPVITLPPKFVELKKVEFSWDERDFYARLEADSRAQFAKYAAAGTVKQNYVNILLMLLRLRQACDHPLLVRKYDSGSAWKSSVDMVKKLPQERQQFLLNCLEGSLAICGICNDSPEDAVVTICGHVFCNQCICEHLTMDDRKCPATNCKDRLSESSVFSKVTLTNLLSLHSGHHNPFDCLTSELAEGVQPFFENGSYESAKIRAAVEVLKALRPQDCAPSSNSVMKSSDEIMSCLENSCDTHSNKFSNDTAKDQNSNCPVKVMGEKAIVFSQWTRMLDLLEARLKKSDIQYRRLDGTMSVTARDKAVKDFNTNPEVSVVIMSLKAASLGLNMVSACHVIMLDLWWNPTTEDQAVDRAHRIGQTRPVKVLRLTVKDTVEDRILALQQKKREMVASAFGEDETGSHQSRLTVEDLNYLFMA